MQVWRRIQSDPYEPDSCETGIRPGFELVGTTDMGITEFLDTNEGAGLAPGNTYCYRLVALYPSPRSAESKVSEEFCITIDVDVPLVTNVSVEETHAETGEILVRWAPAYDVDTDQYPGAYQYELLRAEGFTGDQYLTPLTLTPDTVVTDTPN